MNSKQDHKQNLEPLDLCEQSFTGKVHDEQSRQIAILFEYKMLQMYGSLLGIYAVPNLDNYKIWNCIIFVRKGFYKDGKFKFDIIFGNEFPRKAPAVIFRPPVFHALIREDDGAVDITEVLGEEWNYENQNMLYSLLSNLERMFHDKSRLEVRHSHNPDAAKMLAIKPHAFIERALQSVENSRDSLYQNDPGTSLVIKKYQNGELDGYKNKLEQLCQQNKAPELKRKQFLNFVLCDGSE